MNLVDGFRPRLRRMITTLKAEKLKRLDDYLEEKIEEVQNMEKLLAIKK